MAAVEEEGFFSPKAATLKKAAPKFEEAQKQLEESMQIAKGARSMGPRRLQIEMDATAKDVQALLKSITSMAAELKAGKLPAVASCESSAAALRDIYTTMRRNSRIVRS